MPQRCDDADVLTDLVRDRNCKCKSLVQPNGGNHGVQDHAQEANPTMPSRIDRRTILKGAAAGVAATTLGTVSKRSTFAAPAFLQGTTIVFGADDATTRRKVQPLLDDYQAANNVTIQVEQGPYADFQAKLITNLTQGDRRLRRRQHGRPVDAAVRRRRVHHEPRRVDGRSGASSPTPTSCPS